MARTSSGSEIHAHGCTRCRERYEDACSQRDQDGVCLECRSPGSRCREWVDNRRPKQCCVSNSRLARKEERVTYRLAGQSSWYICAVCRRTHPANPLESR